MDLKLVYSKTPFGEEATRQRTRVVQRNLRMVLLQVDGQLDVAGLIEKIGNESLVLSALSELEQGGFVVPLADAPVARQGRAPVIDVLPGTHSVFEPSALEQAGLSQLSQFSTFGHQAAPPANAVLPTPVAVVPEAEVAQDGVAAEKPASPFMVWCEKFIKPADIRPRHALPWQPLLFAALVFLLLAVFVMWPGDRERRGAEGMLSRALAIPVKVSDIELRIYPRPVVVLRGVQFAALGRCDAIKLPWSLNLLGSGRKQLSEVELVGLVLSADALAGLPERLAGFRDGGELALERLRLTQTSLNLAGLNWRDLEGLVDFAKPNGIMLVSVDRSLSLKIEMAEGKTRLAVEALAWKPLEGSSLMVQSLAAKGVIDAGRLSFDSLEADLLGGRVRGGLQFSWQQRASFAAQMQLERISLQKLAGVLALPLDADGDLGGNLRLNAIGEAPSALWGALVGDMDAQVSKGHVRGIDLGEAARRGGGEPVRGGMTKFDSLAGRLHFADGRLDISGLKLDAGLLQASGRLSVSPQRVVDGPLQVNIRSSVMPIQVPVRVSGTLPVMNVVAGK